MITKTMQENTIKGKYKRKDIFYIPITANQQPDNVQAIES